MVTQLGAELPSYGTLEAEEAVVVVVFVKA